MRSISMLLAVLIFVAVVLAGAGVWIYVAQIMPNPALAPATVVEQNNQETLPNGQKQNNLAEQKVEASDTNKFLLNKEKSYSAGNLPKFEDFPVEELYTGIPAPVDLSTSEALNFKTRLTEGAAKGPNFAGHYTVISWGCGTNCKVLAIVDAKTGKVNIIAGLNPWVGLDYRLDSTLLIANDDPSMGRQLASEKSATLFQTEYASWQDDELNLIYARDYADELSNVIETWQTYRNEEYGFGFKYPAGVLWQDGVESVDVGNCDAENFAQEPPCPQLARYSSSKIILNGKEYWLCRDSEGAAGSRYENYWYFGLANNECFSFKFTVKYVMGCGVYGLPDEPAYRQCEIDNRQKDETIKTIESTFELID